MYPPRHLVVNCEYFARRNLTIYGSQTICQDPDEHFVMCRFALPISLFRLPRLGERVGSVQWQLHQYGDVFFQVLCFHAERVRM